MSKNKEKINKVKYVQSGFGTRGALKNGEKLALLFGYVLGNLSSFISIKNEYKEIQINKLNNEILTNLKEIRVQSAQVAIIKQSIADELITVLGTVQSEKGKYSEYIRRLNEINKDLSENLARFNNKSLSDETVASELIVICEGIKKNIYISSFTQAQVKLENLLDTAAATASPSTDLKVNSDSLANSDHYRIEGLDDINKSSIINFYFYSSINWFEGLIGIQKLAFCIILGKGILISAISSIVFIYYGDVLIENYDLVNK